VGLWTLLAVVTAATLPGFSYLFGWPALAGVGGLLWRPCRRASAILRFSLIAAATLVLMAPAVDVFFSLAQPRPGNPDSEVTAVMIVPLVLVVLVASLLTSGWQHPDREGDAAR
jgi:hypothetical protein